MEIVYFDQIYLPYCLRRLDDGSWVALNRKYKPVGFNTRDWTDYDDYPVSFNFGPRDEKVLRTLSVDDDQIEGIVYLYSDSCAPDRSPRDASNYFNKLGKLMKMSNELG